MTKGWYNEPTRHSLASKGISTSMKNDLIEDEDFVRSYINDSPYITDSVLHDMGDHLSLDFKIDLGIESRQIQSSITIGYRDGINASLRFPETEASHLSNILGVVDKHRSKFIHTVVNIGSQREAKDVMDDLEGDEDVNPHIVINSSYRSVDDVYNFIEDIKEIIEDYAMNYET